MKLEAMTMPMKFTTILGFLFVVSSAFATCPSNMVPDSKGNCCGHECCSFAGIDRSRYVIQNNGCKYCLNNYIAVGDDCEECASNTFGRSSDNTCHGRAECSFSGIDPSRYVVEGHECKYCSSKYIAEEDKCNECPSNTFTKYSDNTCHGRAECSFSGIDPSRYVVQGHECKYCLNDYLALGDDCIETKAFPFFDHLDTTLLTADELKLDISKQKIICALRRLESESTGDFAIRFGDIGTSIHDLLTGDVTSTVGTLLSTAQVGLMVADKFKKDFVQSVQKFMQHIDPELGPEFSKDIELLGHSKFFSGMSEVVEKVGLAYGYVIPVAVKQIEDFKAHVSATKHVADAISEVTITWTIVETSSVLAAAIGGAVFGGAAIPVAVTGFAIGMGVSLLSDKLITIHGHTPADFYRDEVSKIFESILNEKGLSLSDKAARPLLFASNGLPVGGDFLVASF